MVDVASYADAIQQGSRRHLARAITWCESSKPEHREKAGRLLAALNTTRNTHRVGISGVPGAGKSTFINALGCQLVDNGHQVAVLAVDPSSTRSGGSVLGDRTRMADLAVRPEAFVRPSPTAGHLGGVARATREAMILVEAAGYDVVLVETVGVGQSEVAVADMVDTFLLIALARSGDQLQGIKRGILELADVIAVNKADGDNEIAAKKSARELSGAMRMLRGSDVHIPVLTCSAVNKTGLTDVWDAVTAHQKQQVHDGTAETRRAQQQESWLWSLIEQNVMDHIKRNTDVQNAAREAIIKLHAGETSVAEAATLVSDIALRPQPAESPTSNAANA